MKTIWNQLLEKQKFNLARGLISIDLFDVYVRINDCKLLFLLILKIDLPLFYKDSISLGNSSRLF